MYKYILIAFITLASVSGHSFVRDDEFYELTEQTKSNIGKELKKRNYDQTQGLIENWLSSYKQLSSDKREEYRHIEKNMYFLSACVLAEDGETARAISALNEAIVKGYRGYDQIMGDKHLKRLHGIREFKILTDKLHKDTDYLSILRSTAGYKESERYAIRFEYRTDTNLDLLRNRYALEEIAGNGDEQSRMINVMNWVHNRIAHNGARPIPHDRNALSLLEDSVKELDCRGLATILNEAYLALGYSSRITLCLPKDISDGETHAVVSVYSNQYNRWVMMDPTSSAYVTDSSNELLGIREIREKMVAGEKLMLNPDANWNGKVPRTTEEYLYEYMAKNLYWFESPRVSTFGSETFKSGKDVDYIRLYPSGFKDEEEREFAYQFGNVIITSSAEDFWQAPN
jgi:hypothetical protein